MYERMSTGVHAGSIRLADDAKGGGLQCRVVGRGSQFRDVEGGVW